MTNSSNFLQAMCLVVLLLVSMASAATPWRASSNSNLFPHNTQIPSTIQLQEQSSPPKTLPTKADKKTNTNNNVQATQEIPLLVDEKSTYQTTARKNEERRQSRRDLAEMGDYFTDLDIESLEEGFAVGAAFVLLLIVICLLCCCCSMCCGGGRRGGGGCSLMDILAAFCCYEMFCDDSPGCFVPMDGEMC